MNINSKLSVYQAQAGAEVSVDKAEAESEYRDSLLGKAMYYGTAAMSGYTMGNELAKTMQPMVDNMKVRRQARRDYTNNVKMFDGVQVQERYDSFRDFYKKTVKEPAKQAMVGAGPVSRISDTDGTEIMKPGERTSSRAADKATVKAFYLNSVTNYEPTGEKDADGTMAYEQTTKPQHASRFYPKPQIAPFFDYQNNPNLLSAIFKPITQEEYDEAEENSRFIGESMSM